MTAPTDFPDDEKFIKEAYEALQSKIMRAQVLETGTRVDGRRLTPNLQTELELGQVLVLDGECDLLADAPHHRLRDPELRRWRQVASRDRVRATRRGAEVRPTKH